MVKEAKDITADRNAMVRRVHVFNDVICGKIILRYRKCRVYKTRRQSVGE